ncbi:MAG: hypothetical protein K6F34_04630 [Lachnospiraceae bacterium]|nr:hypothetical protein [Lachnospiraceae bacterium]
MNGFEFASSSDAPGILKIMEEDIAPGGLSLLYTRRSDPYASFLEESKESCVGVIKKDGIVIATIAAIVRNMYICGSKKRVCYVTNMKRIPGSEGYLNWHEMFSRMCERAGADAYFCSLLTGNDDVMSMLHKKRKYMPYAVRITGYRTFIFSPKAGAGKRTRDRDRLVFRRGVPEDEEDIVSFLNDHGRKRDMFPAFDKLSDIGDIKADDFFLLAKEGKTVTVGALWNRQNVKQYVLKKCSGIYSLLRRLNFLISRLGYITLPGDDEAADCVFIAFLLAENDDEGYYREFLNALFKEVPERTVLVTGTDTGNPKYPVLDKIRGISFTSELNEVIMTNIDGREPYHFDPGNLEVECALL